MDFSTEFVALRDKLLNRQDPHFRSPSRTCRFPAEWRRC